MLSRGTVQDRMAAEVRSNELPALSAATDQWLAGGLFTDGVMLPNHPGVRLLAFAPESELCTAGSYPR